MTSTDHLTTSIGQIRRASSAAEIQALLQACVEPLGADQAYFVTFVRDDHDLVICRYLLACDALWCRLYLAAGCQHHDPWLIYATYHAEPIAASSLDVVATEHRQVVALIREGGFQSALLVPAHAGLSQSRTSLLCLGFRTPGHYEGELPDRLRLLARALAAELHDWWGARIRRELVDQAQLTPIELSLVRHQCAGHGSKRIADELKVSPASIKSRFQRLHAKLGVINRREAARLLVDCGLILPSSNSRRALGPMPLLAAMPMNTGISPVLPVDSTPRRDGSAPKVIAHKRVLRA